MKYGITTEELSRSYCEQKILKVYKEIGFDAVDYSYDIHAFLIQYMIKMTISTVKNLKLAAVSMDSDTSNACAIISSAY